MAANEPYTGSEKVTMSDVLEDAGYAYDKRQKIFYSVMYPWQRELGYCSLYDEASAAMGMVVDCEPIYFQYAGKYWLVELWKGQYGITTGAEIGVYNTEGPLLDVPGVFNGTFYHAASDEETLSMTYTLLKRDKKKDRVLFNRAGQHWWLTGFVLGEYTDPSDLIMEASITFRDEAMRKAFEEGLLRAGYNDKEYRTSGSTILVLFTKPHTRQPVARGVAVSGPMLKQLSENVAYYKELTKGLTDITDIVEMIKKSETVLFPQMLSFGKPQGIYKLFEGVQLKPELDHQSESMNELLEDMFSPE